MQANNVFRYEHRLWRVLNTWENPGDKIEGDFVAIKLHYGDEETPVSGFWEKDKERTWFPLVEQRNPYHRATFMVGLHDSDGDCYDDRIFVKLAGLPINLPFDTLDDMRAFRDKLDSMINEISQEYPHVK